MTINKKLKKAFEYALAQTCGMRTQRVLLPQQCVEAVISTANTAEPKPDRSRQHPAAGATDVASDVAHTTIFQRVVREILGNAGHRGGAQADRVRKTCLSTHQQLPALAARLHTQTDGARQRNAACNLALDADDMSASTTRRFEQNRYSGSGRQDSISRFNSEAFHGRLM